MEDCVIDLTADSPPPEDNKRPRDNGAAGASDGGGAAAKRQRAGSPPRQAAAPAPPTHGASQHGKPQRTAAGAAPAITNATLAQLHAERLARSQQRRLQAGQHAAQGAPPPPPRPHCSTAAASASHPPHHGQPPRQPQPLQGREAAGPPAAARATPGSKEGRGLSLLTHNVWFEEELAVEARMLGVGGVVSGCGHPDLVCLQEVTPLIYSLLSASDWWQRYGDTGCPASAAYFTVLLWRRDRVRVIKAANIPFSNSIMGRDLKCLVAEVGGQRLVVGTCHLESPSPVPGAGFQLFSRQRAAQCAQASRLLEQTSGGADTIFAGDMNWDEKNDGPPPLPDGWVDAWQQVHPADPGYTYDARMNPMLKGGLRKRLDRAFCRLRSWRLRGAELVGCSALPGLSAAGRPVLPSDHFGLLIKMEAVQPV